MTDADLLTATIAATGLTPAALWRDVLGQPYVSDVYRRTSGERPLTPEGRVLCTLLIASPELLPAVQGAVDAVRAGDLSPSHDQ